MVHTESIVDTNKNSNQAPWSNSSSSNPQISGNLSEIKTRNGDQQKPELRKQNSANRIRRVSSSSKNLENLSESGDDCSDIALGKTEIVGKRCRTKIVLNDDDDDEAPAFVSVTRKPEVRKRKPRTRLSSLNPERKENYAPVD